MNEEEQKALKEKIERKKQRQHEAWSRWYRGPAGQAWKLKRKLKQVADESAK